MEWIKIEDDLPEINKPVTVFYRIPGTARKYYDHIEIGKLKSIIIGKDHPITKWLDLCGNVIVPTHWQPCPEPPKEAETLMEKRDCENCKNSKKTIATHYCAKGEVMFMRKHCKEFKQKK